MPLLARLASVLLDLAAPESCVLCGAARDGRPWCPTGPAVPGVRAWDAPHLCLACAAVPGADPEDGGVAVGRLHGLPVWAARSTGADLIAIVGAWKYQGLRGLAWPLAAAAAAALRAADAGLGARLQLVPVPLHRRRRRERGFNQAAVLARLLARDDGRVVRADVLTRRRATSQQARLADDDLRGGNVAGSCRARPPGTDVRDPEVLLVDDIVTSGATAAEAARALAVAGWRPRGVVALGLRRPRAVDTPERPS